MGQCLAGAASLLILTTLLLLSASAIAAEEQTFDVLQIGTNAYQNVRITTKTKNYIFIMHSGGMINLKVSELPGDILQKLGYVTASVPKTNAAALWARQAVANLDTSQLKRMEAKLLQAWRGARLVPKLHLPSNQPGLIVLDASILLMAYLFLCYCCMLICQKTSNEPGVLVWIPLVQALPMLRAASMSKWWFITLFIPVLNLVGYVLWCVKIVQARNKTSLLMVLLLLPVTSIFAFLYLAFSEFIPKKREKLKFHTEIMTLETA